MAPTEFKNIIFDLGGVIINIDPALSKAAFEELGGSFSEQELVLSDSLFRQLEVGAIGPEQFYSELQQFFDLPIPRAALQNAWNALLLDIPPERIKLLRKVQSRYRTFLLSNTNIIHMDQINADLREVHGITHIDDLFEKAWLSYDMGLKKPDPTIFTAVLDAHGLNPAETLFIDDTQMHIDAAAGLGIQTLHITGGLTINSWFEAQEA